MKILALYIGLLFATLCYSAALAHAGSVIYGSTIDIQGGLKLIDGNLCFADGTCQSTAMFTNGSAVWGEITGYIDNQIDLSAKFNLKEDKSSRAVFGGYAPYYSPSIKSVSTVSATPVWHTQGSVWVDIPEFTTTIMKELDSTLLHLSYTDNIGINGLYWCNVGIFIDNIPVPVCYGSYFGQPYSMSFNQHVLTCDVDHVAYFVNNDPYLIMISSGEHTIKIKHRSQNCVYGNYWGSDEYATLRQLLVREQ